MATAAEVQAIIEEIQAGSDVVLTTLGTVVPSEEIPASKASAIVDLISDLATKALAAWSAAANNPITVESVQALLPNQTPLTPPTS